MRKSAIYKNGKLLFGYATATNNPSEYPPPHGVSDDVIAIVIHDAHRELTKTRDDNDNFCISIRECEYKGGKLHRNGKPLKAQCVEKLRMRNGVLEDNTVHGWKARAIFEPLVDDDGEEIEGPDGEPEGQWYYMGPWGEKKDERGRPEPNLIPIPKPDPQDRRVWKGTQGNEIEPESPIE